MRKLLLACGLAFTVFVVLSSGNLQAASAIAVGGGTCHFTCADGTTWTFFCHAPGETLKTCCSYGPTICAGHGGVTWGSCEDDRIGILCPVGAVAVDAD